MHTELSVRILASKRFFSRPRRQRGRGSFLFILQEGVMIAPMGDSLFVAFLCLILSISIPLSFLLFVAV